MFERDKYHDLGVHTFLLIRQFAELHLFSAQLLLEEMVIISGLWDELVFYATSDVCNGNRPFKLMHTITQNLSENSKESR